MIRIWGSLFASTSYLVFFFFLQLSGSPARAQELCLPPTSCESYNVTRCPKSSCYESGDDCVGYLDTYPCDATIQTRRVNGNGTLGNVIASDSYVWDVGVVEPYKIGSYSYVFMLQPHKGGVWIHRLTTSGTLGAKIWNDVWSSGWTSAQFFAIGDENYIYLMKEGNGVVHIRKVGSGGLLGPLVYERKWSKGWSTAKIFTVGSSTYLLLLKRKDGKVHIHKMNSNGTVGSRVYTEDWSSNWTTVEFFTIGSSTYLFLLKRKDGKVHIHKMNSNGTVGSRVYTDNWTPGWSSTAFYTVLDRRKHSASSYLFLLKEHRGSGTRMGQAHIHKMNSDGTVGPRVQALAKGVGWGWMHVKTIQRVLNPVLLMVQGANLPDLYYDEDRTCQLFGCYCNTVNCYF